MSIFYQIRIRCYLSVGFPKTLLTLMSYPKIFNKNIGLCMKHYISTEYFFPDTSLDGDMVAQNTAR